MKRITSPANPLYDALKKQSQDSRARRKEGVAILDGAHLLQAALAAGIVPDLVAVSDERLDHPETVALLTQISERAQLVMPEAMLAALSTVETPTGLIARIPLPAPIHDAGAAILLDDVQDPGNVGTMLRTAAAAGLRSAYLSTGCADAWSPKVLRAGMGAHFSLAIHERADLLAIVQAAPARVLATDLASGHSLYGVGLPADCAFLFGNEGGGINQALLAIAGLRVRIPMPGSVESLNVAASAAVCLFEWVRQHQAK
ncbi:MAG TPA: RNA methyltransferase [Alphaproteobacteria bacterium]|jgi:TrmH family RNA methyltransferase